MNQLSPISVRLRPPPTAPRTPSVPDHLLRPSRPLPSTSHPIDDKARYLALQLCSQIRPPTSGHSSASVLRPRPPFTRPFSLFVLSVCYFLFRLIPLSIPYLGYPFIYLFFR